MAAAKGRRLVLGADDRPLRRCPASRSRFGVDHRGHERAQAPGRTAPVRADRAEDDFRQCRLRHRLCQQAHLQRCNDRFADMLGFDSGNMIGRFVREIFRTTRLRRVRGGGGSRPAPRGQLRGRGAAAAARRFAVLGPCDREARRLGPGRRRDLGGRGHHRAPPGAGSAAARP